MKNGLKAAFSGLLFAALVAVVVGSWIWDIEELPEILVIADVAVILVLMGYLLKLARSQVARRKKSKEDVLVQRIRQTFESAQLSDAPQPEDILYLRPFRVDETYMSELEYAGKHYYTVESVICRMVEGAGHPVAIGRPGEELQPLGAHRIYTTDDEWKQKVEEYFEHAKCVILYVDFTPGVTWEIETALSKYKDKLVLIPKIYGQKKNWFRDLAMADTTGLILSLYLFASLFTVSKKSRRGGAYYRTWKTLMKGHMQGIKMHDKVSAVIFENGKPLAICACKTNLEEQFLAIHRALIHKLGMEPRQALFLEEGEKPLLTVCADLGIKNAHIAEIYPYVLGQLEFYERGLRYSSAFSLMRFNMNIRHSYKTLEKYKRTQLIPYSAIQDVIPVHERCLQLVLAEANGSMYLTVPKYHCAGIPALRKLLSRCCAEDRFCPAESAAPEQTDKRQRKDYTWAFWLTELFSLVLGAALLVPAFAGSFLAFACLLVYGWAWNFAVAINEYCFLRSSNSRLTKVLGTVFCLIHILLTFGFMFFIV